MRKTKLTKVEWRYFESKPNVDYLIIPNGNYYSQPTLMTNMLEHEDKNNLKLTK